MRQPRGGVGAGRRGDNPGLLTRAVDRVFRFVRLAEFEIFFVLFFLIAFFLFKDLEFSVSIEWPLVPGRMHFFRTGRRLVFLSTMSRPQYNQLFVKKPDLDDPWP